MSTGQLLSFTNFEDFPSIHKAPRQNVILEINYIPPNGVLAMVLLYMLLNKERNKSCLNPFKKTIPRVTHFSPYILKDIMALPYNS